MLSDALVALWFMLPAAIANMVPVFAATAPLLRHFDTPLDLGMTVRGRRLFGAHKTWRGLLVGIVAATFVVWLQQIIFAQTTWLDSIAAHLDYLTYPAALLGLAFATGALGGDAIGSFAKRQIGIAPGKSWLPIDQLDYILGSILLLLPFAVLSLRQYVFILIIWFLMHVIFSYIGYLIGVKKDPI